MRSYLWWSALLALAGLGVLAAGCNTSCQTYCQVLTDHIGACVDAEASIGNDEVWTWEGVGAHTADEYFDRCMGYWAASLAVARTEDRNDIYDWCNTATLWVAGQQDCDAEIDLPGFPSFIDEEDAEDSGGAI